jgi:predicted amidohydrolase YtcJ
MARIVIALLLAAAALSAQAPDLILHNGKVWTVDRARPSAEAIAIAGARILQVGSNAEIDALRESNTRLIDLHGRLVLPGFNDAHTHFENAVQWFFEVRLIDVNSRAELLNRLKEAASRVPAGMWITATDWGALAAWKHDPHAPPTIGLTEVDTITPRHPVLLRRYDRAFFANSEAMRLARIRETTPDPKGGRYGRDPVTGKLNGMLFGSAGEQVELMLPPSTAAKKRIGALGVIAELNRAGITSIHDIARLDALSQEQTPSIFVERSYSDINIFRGLEQRGELHVRVYAFMPLQSWAGLARFGILPHSGDDLLRFGILKDFTDGSLMLEPYFNNPANSGNWTFRFPGEQVMAQNIIAADRAGFDIGIHVTGDKALRATLDWYDAAVTRNGPRERRDRLIHVWYAQQEDLQRAGRMHLIADITPDQLINDISGVEALAGPERAKTAFAWRTMIDAGVRLDLVSDLPGLFNKQQVATIEPLKNIYMAVTRRRLDGTPAGGWHAEQCITVNQAIEAYTINPAFASHEENLKGSITAGKLADLVVLSTDILHAPPESLLSATVDYTILGGEIVFERRP